MAAQHAHEEGRAHVMVTHDLADDGWTYVGNLNHFGWVLFGDDGTPQFHHNARVEVTLNGVLVYATEPSSGHDYDGAHEVAVAFPVSGRYEVTVTVPTEEGDQVGTFSGSVGERAPEPVTLDLVAPTAVTAGEPFTLDYALLDEGGAVVPHSDVLVEVRSADRGDVLRLHTHTHRERQAINLALDGPATYEVRLTAYQAFPEKGAFAFAPVTTTHAITVDQGVPLAGVLAPPTEQPLTNRVDASDDGAPYKLYATYDPYTSVSTWGRIRLDTVVVDATGMPVPHVDMSARVVGPDGRTLLESASLHEYDGVLELAVAYGLPGDYTLDVTATKGDWTGSVTHRFSVIPPLAATAAGPQLVELRGSDVLSAGEPAAMSFFVHNGAMVPFMHGEVDLTVRDAATGVAILTDKLHTHSDGVFPFTLTLPTAGTYTIEADPLPTTPAPTPLFYGATPGQPPVFTVEVGEGPGLPVAVPDEPLVQQDRDGADTIPSIGVLALVVLAAAALVLRRP